MKPSGEYVLVGFALLVPFTSSSLNNPEIVNVFVGIWTQDTCAMLGHLLWLLPGSNHLTANWLNNFAPINFCKHTTYVL